MTLNTIVGLDTRVNGQQRDSKRRFTQRDWWAALEKGVERLAPRNSGDDAAASGGGGWCVKANGHRQRHVVPIGFSPLSLERTGISRLRCKGFS